MHHCVCASAHACTSTGTFLFNESLATGYFALFAWWSTLHVAPPHLHLLPLFLLADLSSGFLASSAGSLASLHKRLALHYWPSSTPTTVPLARHSSCRFASDQVFTDLTGLVGLRCWIANDQAQGRLSCFFATVDQHQRRMELAGLLNSSVGLLSLLVESMSSGRTRCWLKPNGQFDSSLRPLK